MKGESLPPGTRWRGTPARRAAGAEAFGPIEPDAAPNSDDSQRPSVNILEPAPVRGF
jgi:hypothetical protein